MAKYGMKIPKSVPSPTGKPSPKSSGVKKMEAGDYSGGERPPKQKTPEELEAERKKKALKDSGGKMRVEEALWRSGVYR